MNETLALIGKGTTSYGCGVLVTYNQVKYLATAGHVVRVMGTSPYWAIHSLELKRTLNPTGGYKIMVLVDEVIDTQGKSDLAICKLTRDIYIETVNLNDLPPAGNLIGRKVIALGYPVDYVLENLKLESDKNLPPLVARGVITSSFDSKITVASDEIPLSGCYYVRMEQALQNHGSGFSGALVTDVFKTPLGIIVAGSENGDLIFSPMAKVKSLLMKMVFSDFVD